MLQAALLPQQTHTVLEASFKLLDRCGQGLRLPAVVSEAQSRQHKAPYQTFQLSRF